MSNRIIVRILALVFLFNLQAKADEGMWLLTLIGKKYEDMKRLGFKLTPEDIYSVNHSSLKDAVVRFGGGCTAEIISKEGLLLTNHHCGYGSIQSLSSDKSNYLRDGFWAMSKQEELPCPGLSVSFLVRMEDVTQQITAALSDTMSAESRSKKMQELFDKISKEATKDNQYTAYVSSFFEGNEFYLMVFEVYKDVRLVGTPPESIGKFGGDTDNWMWPRHTGDFSMFRVYMSPDGKPADYAQNNIPLKPKHYFPISIKGVQKNDFSMIIGFPGSTNRYLTSYGVDQAINIVNPAIVKIRDKKLSIMREYMDKDEAVRLKYASKYAGIANYWKYFIGQTQALKRLKVYDKKVEQEKAFQAWVNQTPDRKTQYSTVIHGMEESYRQIKEFQLVRTYMSEALLRGPECISLAGSYLRLYNFLKEGKGSEEKKKEMIDGLKTRNARTFKNYYQKIDENLFYEMLKMFYTDIDKKYHPEIFSEIEKEYAGDFMKLRDAAFSASLFTDSARLSQFLENPDTTALKNDLIFKIYRSCYKKANELESKYESYYEQLETNNRLFVKGFREMQNDKFFYPDANGTMRLTYGQVLDYHPRDAVDYNFYTTLRGVIEKEDPANDEFVVHPKLKELYKNKNYGRYAENGELRINFISNNDITGGNSGSPVLNANGELIGTAFDGNWEAMSGDITFEPLLQRTISLDIRYTLFIIDKFAGAKNLIDEMTIVN